MEEEEKMREIEDLYLPPRRKTQVQGNNSTSIGEEKSTKARKSSNNNVQGKKRKKVEVSEDEDESEEESSSDRPRKRGRPSNKERLLNFTDAELRRFIKSYKKFPAPLKRLDAIASDADLEEKSLHDLKKLGEMLRKRCAAFMADHKDLEPSPNEVKKRGARAGFSVKFGGASFNAKTLWSCEEELQPLDELVPSNKEERMKWLLDIKTRPANFDVEWTMRDDSRLLIGIYQYGMGSWEMMKMDPALELSDKILANGDAKPQAKHLQTRAEYLLKVMRKNLEMRKNGKKARKPRKNKDKMAATSVLASLPSIPKDGNQSLDDISSSNDDKKPSPVSHIKREPVDPLGGVGMDIHHTNSNASLTMDENSKDGYVKMRKNSKSKDKDRESKKNKKKYAEGPMHFTANNEPRALTVLGDLDPNVFNECKEKMRPVKKALKALDNPDQSLSAQEQVAHTTECLLSIGKQIDECLRVYSDPDKIKEWRSNLWYFVSKFTEFCARKLFKLYKRALKKSMDNGTDGGGGEGYARAGSSNNNGVGSDGDQRGDAKEMKSFNRKSSHYQDPLGGEKERRSKHDRDGEGHSKKDR